jgi:hypothetical protein
MEVTREINKGLNVADEVFFHTEDHQFFANRWQLSD